MRLSKLRSVCAFALAASAAAFVGRANADVIVSNLADTTAGAESVEGNDAQIVAQEFVTGSQSESLGDVIVHLGFASGTLVPQGELTADNSGTIGANLTSLIFPPSPANGDVTLTPASNITLAANTGYWVILSAGTDSADYAWNYTSTTSSSFPNDAVSTDGGSMFFYNQNPGTVQLEVDSASVPEPASLGILALGGIALLRRRGRPSALLFRQP
jgi:hypothetical protein